MANAGVLTTHPDYDAMAPTWRKLRDVYEGRDALIRGRTRYLPQPTAMDNDVYSGYVERAKWFGATRRSVQAFEGLAFRQPIAVETPRSLTPQLETLTSTGVTLTGLARLAFRETLLLGRYGLLVDMDASGARPYWAGYPAESILNWSTALVGGRRQVTRVVLKECSWVLMADGFTQQEIEQVRVLQLIDGVYAQTVYQVTTGRGGVVLDSEVVAQRRDRPLDFIPFVFFGVNDLEPTVELSAINDLVDTNLAYWRHSADYEQSLHLTASPTPWITGHDATQDVGPDGKQETTLKLGSNSSIILREEQARIGMLEFQGHGLQEQRQALTDDKLEMASLGARLLEGQPANDETLGAFRMRQMGDTSVLAALAQSLSDGLTRLLRAHAYWDGAASTPEDMKITCHVPANFTTAHMEPQMLTALVAAVQGGYLSNETLYYNLRQGEIAEPGVDFETEQARIEAATPAMVRLPMPTNGVTNGRA